MAKRSCLAVVLAAGQGTRMRSSLPKVLHAVAGRPMLGNVIEAARGAGSDTLAVVVGHGADRVREYLASTGTDARSYVQETQEGTAHAVLAAREALEGGHDDVLVLFGDAPMLTAATLRATRDRLSEDGAAVVVVGFRTPPPNGYGRLIERDGELVAIREVKDASEDERRIELCNGGFMALAGEHALALLDAIGNDNAKGEYYLTDVVEVARARGLRSVVHVADADEVLGVNDRAELAEAEAIWQRRRRGEMLRAGVTMPDPASVHLAFDTRIEPDAVVEPFVFFGPGAAVEAGATVLSHSRIEGATVRSGATVGPFARLRPGTIVGAKAKVGNFCEVKNAELGEGAKVNHLSYVGDAAVGDGANVGAGTITCNYDGVNKHRTEIGAGSFVGSNTSLVAPVSVGEGAYVASGSVVTQDVPADALAFGRARQSVREGYAPVLRERAETLKSAGRAECDGGDGR